MIAANKIIHFGLKFLILVLLGKTLAFPQSSRFDQKQAVLTDNKGQVGVVTLDSRFDSDNSALPQHSIGYYPYGSGKVSFLIQKPYPQIPTFYGYNSQLHGSTGGQNNVGG